MIDIDRKDLQESRLSSGGDCIGSVVRVGPCIGAIGETTVRKVVYYAFVGVLLRAHEDQMFQGVRTTTIIENLSGHHKITIHEGSLVIQVNHIETSDPTTPAGNRDIRKVDLDTLYEIKVSKSLGR